MTEFIPQLQKWVHAITLFLFPSRRWMEEAKLQTRFSAKLYVLLCRAGRFNGRNVEITVAPDDKRFHEAALSVLREFSGLTINPSSDVRFGEDRVIGGLSQLFIGADMEYAYDPDEEECFQHLRLCFIGLVEQDGLMLDDAGGVYDFGREIKGIARSFDRALELLLLGRRPSAEDLRGLRRFRREGERFLFVEENAEIRD
jgi:hypothetical protein